MKSINMKSINYMKSKNIYFLLLIFIIGFLLFYKKEGFYGYDQQWNSPLREWTPCDISYYSVANPPNDNKCCSRISIWNPDLSLCHPECDTGMVWNKKQKKCVDQSTRCPKGYSMYKGKGKCGNPGFTNDVDSNF
jgi:hypothetical protein